MRPHGFDFNQRQEGFAFLGIREAKKRNGILPEVGFHQHALRAFTGGERYALPFEFLRVNSPSAEVKGHGPGQETLVLGKQAVMVSAVEPVGQYAVRLIFDDGHDSGLYSWKYLRELGRDQDVLWRQYLERVTAATAKG